MATTTTQMTISQFAELVGVHRSYIHKHLIQGKLFKGMISKTLVGKYYVLEVDKKKASKELQED